MLAGVSAETSVDLPRRRHHDRRVAVGEMQQNDLPSWEHFEHRADMGVRGRGRSPDEAFEQAAVALTAVVLEPAEVRRHETVTVRCEEPELELLLVSWLNAVVYEMATRRMLFGSYSVHIEGLQLTGSMEGELVDQVRHQPAVEVKGATFTALRVAQEPDGSFVAQCVVDV